MSASTAETPETHSETPDAHGEGSSSSAHVEAADAILFPWFALIIGTCAYYALSRYAPWMPYTAVMFCLGTIMGVCSVRLDQSDILQVSIDTFWLNIDHEVLLVVFLSGLIAKDALCMDVHLFQAAFWQCFVFAFPMVLAGTSLTACIGYFVFPYSWSFNFSMMFGSILSATDPVAVSALLEQVGAPPRLKVHISGESLLNDGAAIVFFTIFSQMFLLELGLPDYGQEIDVATGFALFFRMSLGAFASGLFFGLSTCLLLWLLDRRLSRSECVVEIATTLTMAYLCYFVSDVVWRTSGVIATLTFGLVVNALCQSMINDMKFFEETWELVEHLLNTVLFTLGGLFWGSVIANDSGHPEEHFVARDWGYLFLLFVLLMAIRYFLFASFYPVTVNIGLSTNWREQVFQCWAGLRGAVGIALAIAIDSTVEEAAAENPDAVAPAEKAIATQKLFGMVGGIAFLTLLISAIPAAPMLRKLGLADTTETRRKVLELVRCSLRRHITDRMVELLALNRYQNVNFAVVRHHVSLMADLSPDQLSRSVKKYMRLHGQRRRLKTKSVRSNILPYLQKRGGMPDAEAAQLVEINQILSYVETKQDHNILDQPDERQSLVLGPEQHNPSIIEIRHLYLEILRGSYARQIEAGELTGRHFIAYTLLGSVDHARDAVSRGAPLNDWDYTNIVRQPLKRELLRLTHTKQMRAFKARVLQQGETRPDIEHLDMRYDVERCLAFLEGHRLCREIFQEEFDWEAEVGKDAHKVLLEAQAEMEKAKKVLTSYPVHDIEAIVSHKFCEYFEQTVM